MPSPTFSAKGKASECPNAVTDLASRAKRFGHVMQDPTNSSLLAFCLAGALYCGLASRILLAGLSLTGTLTYPLDDTYIGMAMAKNFALHGVWGITPAHFSSASSSPGFLLLLSALYRLTGPTDWWPVALSLSFGVLSVFLASRLLKGTGLIIQLIAMCALVFFTPLHIMGLLGMEHTLHLALTIGFLHLAGHGLAQGQFPSGSLLALATVMVSVRYEGFFVIAAACLLYLLQRQFLAAIALAVAGALPVVAYGFVAVALHSYWLPHSIALKGLSGEDFTHSPFALIENFHSNVVRAPYLATFLAMIIVLLALPRVRTDKCASSILAIVFGAIFLHLALADIGWAHRYEAYLVASAMVAVALAIPRAVQEKRTWTSWAIAPLLILGAIGAYFLSLRTREANRTLPYRSAGVYSQQIQMARFLRRFEEGVSVAANDVGAINYYANIDCLDLVGLADQEVFALKRKKEYSTAAILKLATDRQVKIALVYDTWFSTLPLTGLRGLGGPPLPNSWIRVARWSTPYGQFLGGGVVSFYATDPTEAARLRDSLARFASSLAPKVEVLWK